MLKNAISLRVARRAGRAGGRRHFAMLFGGLLLFAAAPALAQTSAAGNAPAASGKAQPESVKVRPESVKARSVVHVGKASLVNLSRDVQDVLISDPETVDGVLRTSRQMALIGKKTGQTNVLFFDAGGRQILSLDVFVEVDTDGLQRALIRHFPRSRVKVESLLDETVLTGHAPSMAEANEIKGFVARYIANASKDKETGGGEEKELDFSRITNRITTPDGEQIMLKVHVAELNRTMVKKLGIEWESGLKASSLIFTAPYTQTTSLFSDYEGEFSSRATLDSLLKALEEHGMVRILAEPSLTAISGGEASFLAGGEFPIPVAQEDNKLTIQFKKFGVGLKFLPLILGNGRINLRIATEVSELSESGSIRLQSITIPGIAVRRANTTVELPSGGSIAIAGMMRQSTRRVSAGIPGLRDLPILGQLFRSEAFENDETELVILVTPFIVRHGQRQDFRLPTDGFAPASDFDMYVLGALHDRHGAGEPSERAMQDGLAAPFGYILE